jgi:hypothetical protein
MRNQRAGIKTSGKKIKNGQDYSHMMDHASSMKKSEAFVPMNIQRMTPDQIVRAFEKGLATG